MTFRLSPELLFSRGEPEDRRLGEIAQMVSPQSFSQDNWDWAILGFPDDRGIALNKGRIGAKEGPNAIRKWFYRLVPPNMKQRIADLGDLEMTNDLAVDHEEATQAIAFALSAAKRVAILGGGHDWGFCPIAALMKIGSVGFVNIDAHLDVRPSETRHSGTSYWRALETGVKGENAAWYGVQRAATSTIHEGYVIASGGRVLFADDEESQPGRIAQIGKEISAKCDSFDLSLDLDVFEMSVAPGVSAPQPTGLSPRSVLDALAPLASLSKLRTFGIYELSPQHDSNESTARLAARCLWEVFRSS
jgi:formimidoylglutamase